MEQDTTVSEIIVQFMELLLLVGGLELMGMEPICQYYLRMRCTLPLEATEEQRELSLLYKFIKILMIPSKVTPNVSLKALCANISCL